MWYNQLTSTWSQPSSWAILKAGDWRPDLPKEDTTRSAVHAVKELGYTAQQTFLQPQPPSCSKAPAPSALPSAEPELRACPLCDSKGRNKRIQLVP